MPDYYAGKKGRMVVQGLSDDLLRMESWSYQQDRSNVDITNSLSFGKDQFIPNLQSGRIRGSGFVTNTLVTTISSNDLRTGQEVKFDLYFDKDGNVGFKDIDAIIDDFEFEVTVDGASRWRVTASVSEPRI